MSENDGNSTVTGVGFEAWVAAEFLSEVILDNSISVKPQAKIIKDINGKEDKPIIEDIIVIRKDNMEFYDCKYRAPKAGQWTFARLKEHGVLDRLKKQYLEIQNYKLFFATESPCPLIDEGFQRSAASETAFEARTRLKKGGYEIDWDKAKKYLGFTDEKMIAFTKKVDFHPVNLKQLKRNIILRLRDKITQVDSLPVLLKGLAEKAAGRGESITQDKIIDYLKENGVAPKAPLGTDEIIREFKIASADLSSIKSTIGRKHHILRDETQRLIEWIETTSEEKKAACLIGTMGIGKTVITHDLCKELQNKSIPVLGIKTDHYSHIKKRGDLYKELGLKDEILNLVATVAESKGKCVVIFDQMDALSDSLSKDRTPLNIIINFVNNLVLIPNVKVIISCRKFDLDHDPTLSEIEFEPKVEVVLLSIDKVKEVLNNLGISVNVFTEKQIRLFQTPLHLQLLSEVYEPTMPIDSIQTLQDLFDKLWDKFIDKGNGKDVENKTNAIYKIVDRMDTYKELTAPLSILDKHLSNARTGLQSNGILMSIKSKQIGFFHQSFFDYCYARRFAYENKSLTEKILKEHQGLFVRSQIKHVLSYLRGAEPSRYIKELKALLESNKVRHHIKDLIISLLGNQLEPIDVETDYVRQLFQRNHLLRDHFLKVVDSPEWFDILNEEYIKPLIMDDEKVLFLVMNYYQKILNSRTKEIFALMNEVPNFLDKDKWCDNYLWSLENWCEEAIEFFKQMRKRFDLNNILSEENIYHILGNMYKERKKEAFYLMLNELDYKIESLKISCDEFDNGKRGIIGWGMLEIFKKALKDIPDIATKEVAIKLKDIVELTKFKDKEKFYTDRAFLLYEPRDDLYGAYRLMNEFIASLKKLIRDEKHEFIRDIIKTLRPTYSVTINRILIWIYAELPELYKDDAYELLSIPEALLEIGSGYCSGYDARNLLTKIYPLFNQKQRDYIERVILQIDPEWEKGYPKQRGRSKYLALSAIPREYLSGISRESFQELERRFNALSDEKPYVRGVTEVGSPIQDNSLNKMNLKQWLTAFKKYDDNTSWNGSKRDLLKGGVIELSRSFEKIVKERPNNFYNFVLNLYKENVSLSYVSKAINGFIGAEYDYQKIKDLILKYFKYNDNDLRKSIISAIEALNKIEPIDSELFNILADYALNDPDPCKELYRDKTPSGNYNYDGDAVFYGINTIRGNAAMAITHHGFRTGDSESVFKALDRIAEDPFVSVRSCMITDLAGMLKWAPKRTFSIYKKALNNMDTELLTHSGRFLGYALDKSNFVEIIPFLKQMALNNEHDTSKSAGHLAMIAVLEGYHESETLLNELLPTSSGFRVGGVDVCMRNITHAGFKKLCKVQLKILLNVYLEDVASNIAWHINDLKVKDFDTVLFILEKLSTSNIKNPHSNYVMDYLLKCVSLYPDKCIYLINNFVNIYDLNDQISIFPEVIRIVTGAYLKTSNDECREKALDILDGMYEVGYYNVRNFVADQDR